MSKSWKVILALILLSALMTYAALNLLLRSFIYWGVTVQQSPSPAKVGHAVLYTDAKFLDTVVTLYVRDYQRPDKGAIEVCLIENNVRVFWPDKIIWSKDGTVIAVLRGQLWTDAYDFRNHNLVYLYSPQRQKAAEEKSHAIANLLKSRGGEGPAVAGEPHDPSLWEHYP